MSGERVVKSVHTIEFAAWSDRHIKLVSAVEVVTNKLTRGKNAMQSVEGGLLDPRMGTSKSGANNTCAECELDFESCPGHWGYLRLALPRYNPNFIDYVKKILCCVCLECCRLISECFLGTGAHLEYDARLDHAVYELGKIGNRGKRCSHCDAALCAKVTADSTKRNTLFAVDQNKESVELRTKRVRKILSNISHKDYAALGFDAKRSHPKYFMQKCLPIPPINIRPSDIRQRGDSSHNKLTNFLSKIVYDNTSLREELAKLKAAKKALKKRAEREHYRGEDIFADLRPCLTLTDSLEQGSAFRADEEHNGEHYIQQRIDAMESLLRKIRIESEREQSDQQADDDEEEEEKDDDQSAKSAHELYIVGELLRDGALSDAERELYKQWQKAHAGRAAVRAASFFAGQSDTQSIVDGMQQRLSDCRVLLARAQSVGVAREWEESIAWAKSATRAATLEKTLQHKIVCYVTGKIRFPDGVPHNNAIANMSMQYAKESLKGRLGGGTGEAKKNRFVENIIGKRTENAGRGVIDPGQQNSINQVTQSEEMARNLTTCEYVYAYNIDKLRRCVANGTRVYPGAKKIIYADGSVKTLDGMTAAELSDPDIIQLGDCVERHLMDNDSVLMNRQPTLHKSSIMAHNAKIRATGNTIRLNPAVMPPYNADCDGDEMNQHVPTYINTMAEIEVLSKTEKMIVSPGSSSPVIGFIQDTLIGARLFLKDADVFSERRALELLSYAFREEWSGELPPSSLSGRRWTAADIFSALLPPTLCMRKHTKDGALFEIRNGRYVSGVVSKEILGTAHKSLIHVINNDFGPEEARKFIDRTQFMLNHWLESRGFTFSAADLYVDAETASRIEETIRDGIALFMDENVKHSAAKDGISIEHLSKARDEVVRELQTFLSAQDSNMQEMVMCGSKGSRDNVQQMLGCLGQQVVHGKPLAPVLSRNITSMITRSSSDAAHLFSPSDPHRASTTVVAMRRYLEQQRYALALDHLNSQGITMFGKFTATQCPFEPSANKIGFVARGFRRGLYPTEYFEHAFAGREGLIDTASKTAKIGYTQRKLVKTAEDISIRHDGTVRDARDRVLQFSFGNDGLNTVHLEMQSLDVLEMNAQQRSEALFWPSEIEQRSAVVREERARIEAFLHKMQRVAYKLSSSASIGLPIDIERAVMSMNERAEFFLDTPEPLSDSDSQEYAESVIAHIERFLELYRREIDYSSARENSSNIVECMLRTMLCSRACMLRWRLSVSGVEHLLMNVARRKFIKAIVDPGEPVGPIAATEMGEPATQMTLNTFHLAGVGGEGSAVVTSGVPRLLEITGATQQQRSSVIYLWTAPGAPESATMELCTNVQGIVLSDLVLYTETLCDPERIAAFDRLDASTIELFYKLSEANVPSYGARMHPEVFRMVLDKQLTESLSIRTDRIESALAKRSYSNGTQLEVIASRNDQIERIVVITVLKLNMPSNCEQRALLEREFGVGNAIAPVIVEKSRKFDIFIENMTLESALQVYDDCLARFCATIDERAAAIVRVRAKRSGAKPSPLLVGRVQSELLEQDSVSGLKFVRSAKISREKRRVFVPDTQSFELRDDTHVMLSLEPDAKTRDCLGQMFMLQGIDHSRCYSNNIHHIYETLGIGAAKLAMHKEIMKVYRAGGIGVNPRHVTLMVDAMTRTGEIAPCTWHGINKTERTDPIKSIVFERCMQGLSQAGAFGVRNDSKSVNMAIMNAQGFPMGTGIVKLQRNKEVEELYGVEQRASAPSGRVIRAPMFGTRSRNASSRDAALFGNFVYDPKHASDKKRKQTDQSPPFVHNIYEKRAKLYVPKNARHNVPRATTTTTIETTIRTTIRTTDNKRHTYDNQDAETKRRKIQEQFKLQNPHLY